MPLLPAQSPCTRNGYHRPGLRRAADRGEQHVNRHLLKRDIVVFRGRHDFGSPEVVQDPDVGYVQLGKEPVVAGRPVFHLRVANEQRLLGNVPLCLVHLKDTRETNVLAAGCVGVWSVNNVRSWRSTDPRRLFRYRA